MSDNYSLSGAVAISYGSLAPVTSPADRLRRNVKRLLKQHGKSQADLARHVGKSRPWISQLLSGRRATTMATLGLIAEFFPGADVADLFVAQESTTLTGRDTPVHSQSASNSGIGEAHAASTHARGIESKDIRELRKSIRQIARIASSALGDDDAERSAERVDLPKARARRRPDSRSA